MVETLLTSVQGNIFRNEPRVLELIEEVVGLVHQQRLQAQQPLHPGQSNTGPIEYKRGISEFRKMTPTFKGITNPHETEA